MYYYGQKYWFAFTAGILYSLCNCCFAILFYVILNFQKLSGYSIPLSFLSLGAGIIYAASLLFLPAENKCWLKAAGAFMLIIGLIVLSSLTWSIRNSAFAYSNTAESISQWSTFASCLIPVLFIMHFLSEGRNSRKDGTRMPAQK